MARIGIQSGTEGTEFYPVLRSGNGRARLGRDGFVRALRDARIDSDEAWLAEEADDEALWAQVDELYGASKDEDTSPIPNGYSIVADLVDGTFVVFCGEEEIQAVETLAEGVLVASGHDGSTLPSP